MQTIKFKYLFLACSKVLTVSSKEFCISEENLLFNLCLKGSFRPESKLELLLKVGLVLVNGLIVSGSELRLSLLLKLGKSSSTCFLISTKLFLLGASVTVKGRAVG